MCGRWDDPEKTVTLLDELEGLGFDDDAFWRVHHSREKGRHETIKRHRAYCNEHKSFRRCGSNSLVQERLATVLKSFKTWRGAGHPNFANLAEDAFSKQRHPECSG